MKKKIKVHHSGIEVKNLSSNINYLGCKALTRNWTWEKKWLYFRKVTKSKTIEAVMFIHKHKNLRISTKHIAQIISNKRGQITKLKNCRYQEQKRIVKQSSDKISAKLLLEGMYVIRSFATSVLLPHTVIEHFHSLGVLSAIKQGAFTSCCPHLSSNSFQAEKENR